MSYQSKIAKALSYIEENLKEKINLTSVARAATMSPYHFHRIFQFSTGEIIGEYIRKRRLSCAADDLLKTPKKVIEIALDYGFDSVEAFSRSFKKQMQVSPLLYRKNSYYDRRLIKDPIKPDLLQHLVDGGISLTPSFIELEPFRIVGFYGEEIKSKIAKKFTWAKNELAGRRLEIESIDSSITYYAYPPVLGIDIWNQLMDTKMKIIVGLKADKSKPVPAEMTGYDVEGGKYAVFTHLGPPVLASTFAYIFNIWFAVNEEYELDERTDFFLYDENQNSESAEKQVKIYIPVKTVSP